MLLVGQAESPSEMYLRTRQISLDGLARRHPRVYMLADMRVDSGGCKTWNGVRVIRRLDEYREKLRLVKRG